jgi:hypothetical protein
MKCRKFSLALLLLSFITISCQTDYSKNQFIVPENPPREIINLSQDLGDYKIIHLSTSDSVLLGSAPYKVYTNKDKIYVFDPGVGKGLFIFDENGKFIKKIINNGGEGVYSLYQAQDFVILPDENRLGIFDLKSQSLLFFDLNQFNYLNTIGLPRPITNLEYFKDSFYLTPSKRSDSEDDFFIEKWNKDLTELQATFFPYKENSNGNFRLSHKINHNEELLSFWEPFNDTIYTYDASKNRSDKILVNFPSKLPPELYKKTLAEKLQFVQSMNSGFVFVNNVIHTQKITVFNFISENGPINFVKRKGEIITAKKIQIDDLLLENIVGYASSKQLFTFVIDPTDWSNPKLVLINIEN